MDPKEKAKELINKFLPLVKGGDLYDTYYNKSKQCALICVEEIIESHLMTVNCEDLVIDFWNDVKMEINKL